MFSGDVESGVESNYQDPKCKVGDHVKITKYKKVFAKGYTTNWSEEIFVNKKVKNTIPLACVIRDINSKDIVGTFYEKELQKISQTKFRFEKVIVIKGDRRYVKQNNPLNMIIHSIAGLI